jgi:ligand-binding sensor domain-containing protein
MGNTRPVPTRLWTSYALFLLLCLISFTGFAQRKSIKQYVHQVWTTENGLPQNSAGSIVQTRDGYIWFATQEGLARFDGVEFKVFDRTNTKELPSSSFVRMKEDSAGGLWARPIGFAPGVVRYHNGSFTLYDTSNALPNNRTVTWETDKRGTMWLGTPGGLVEFNNGRFRTYTVRDGLPADTVFRLGLDSKENLWISTTGGLARLAGGKIEKMTGQKDFPPTVMKTVMAPSG